MMNITNKLVYFTFLSLVALLNAGCSTLKAYQGKTLPNDQTATVTKHPYAPVYIEAVNGFPFRYYHQSAEILPGKNTVTLKIFRPGDENQAGVRMIEANYVERISFEAKPKRVYEVQVIMKKDNYWFWVEDKYSREVVGGRKP